MVPLGASMRLLPLLCIVLVSLAPHTASAQSDATDPVPALEPDAAAIAARYGEGTSGDYAAAAYGYGEYGYGYYSDYGSGIGYGGYGSAAPAPLSAVVAVAQRVAAAAAAEHKHVAHLISADEAAAEQAAAATTAVAAAAPVAAAARPAARRLIEATGPGGAAASYIQAAAAAQPVPRSAPTCPPCPTCVANEPRSLFMHHRGAPPTAAAAGHGGGSCYCRYHGPSGQWALREPSCRAALTAKCGPAGSLLECSALQAFFAAPDGKAASAAADQISAFLFVDCPPNPPCSCEALRFDGRGAAAAARTQCCGDLRAHCRTPFSGLDCEEVDAFCAPDAKPRQLSASLRQFVAVKTHGRNCAEPQARRAYARFAADGSASAATFGGEPPRPAHGLARGGLGVSGSTILFLVGAACVAVGVAVAGAVIVLQVMVSRHEAPSAAPLLSS